MKRNKECVVSTRRKVIRRVVSFCLAGTLLFGSAITASAATLKDVFDAEYYADSYEDLEKAFGTNEKALYNHYKVFGQKEGRSMNMLIDLVKYREAYEDLDAAFGDDWEAYLNHYLTYGIEEGRNSFGTFDARAYADRYFDLKLAFGYDVMKLYEHYLTFGRAEGRNAGPEPVVNRHNSGGSSNNSSAAPEINYGSGPVVAMGRLVDPETGEPIANATITFTAATFNTLSEITSDVTNGDASADVTPGDGTASDVTPGDATPEEGVPPTAGIIYGDGYYQVTTDENGYYEIPNFEPGVYSAEVSAPGCMDLTLNSIVVSSNSGSVTLPTFWLLSDDISGVNTVAGTAKDAISGAGLGGATIKVRENWNNQSGAVIGTTSTDAEGNYSIDLPRGYYTFEFIKDGYTSVFVNVAGTNAVGVAVLNPTTSEVGSTEYRIVLTWGVIPSDLDSHIVGPVEGATDGSCFHVFFADKVYNENGVDVVTLDIDDVTSYGPETVTVINAENDETYFYSVHDFSNGGNAESIEMAGSGANIKVYRGSVLVKEYNVPVNQAGYVWNVFKIENGTIVDINNYNSDYSTMFGTYNPDLVVN